MPQLLLKYGNNSPTIIKKLQKSPLSPRSLKSSENNMNLKLTLGILSDKLRWSMILSTWSRDFFWKCIWSVNFEVFLPSLLHQKTKLMACLNVDTSTKKLQTL